MLMEVRDEQPEKQRFPKLVTEEGMSMEVRDELSEYLQLTVYQCILIKTVEK